jgi:hypothetical protein
MAQRKYESPRESLAKQGLYCMNFLSFGLKWFWQRMTTAWCNSANETVPPTKTRFHLSLFIAAIMLVAFFLLGEGVAA